MAKPKRRQRHPAATVGQQSSAKRTGASATGGVGKGSVQKKVTDSTKVVSTGTSSGAGDVPPYDSLGGGIPFVDFGGLYMTSGGSYDVGILHVDPSDQNSQALSYAQIVSGLLNARNPIAQGIVGTANRYTAAICKMTNNADKAVCSSSTISQIEAQLPSK